MAKLTNHRNELIKIMRSLGRNHSLWRVFEDFTATMALSISNGVDQRYFDEREADYLKIIKQYSKEEALKFPEMAAHLIEELEFHKDMPEDVFGPIYHELELHNKWRGQFFTPQHVSDLISRICITDDVGNKPYISLAEPCCGSGAMILSAINAHRANGCKKPIYVDAMDIDLKCVHMCYAQLSLYGIPGIVRHGNTLSLEIWSDWITPAYVWEDWQNLRKFEDMYSAIKEAEELLNTKPEQNESPQFYATDSGQMAFGL